MRPSTFAGIAISALLVTPAAYAQQSSQTQPSKTPQTSETQKNDNKDMAATQTFTGCVMTEPEYRQAHNLGKGMLGGAGLGNEYVLVDAKVAPTKGSMSDTSGMSSSTTPKSTSSNASKCADQGMAYRLTGKDEPKVKSLVGKEIEVQGRLKDVTGTTATGTAGTSSDDKKLPPEVEIVSFHEAGGNSDMNAPVAAATTPATSSTSSTSASSTTRTPPRASATEPDPTQTANPPKQLPHSASPMALFALIGGLALISGLALTMMKRA